MRRIYYKNVLVYETEKNKGQLELELPFKFSFLDDVKIAGGSEFSLIVASKFYCIASANIFDMVMIIAEKHSKMIQYFFRQLENSYRNRHVSDIEIVVTNTAY